MAGCGLYWVWPLGVFYRCASIIPFANTARDETNLDALTGELVEVVRETLQPARVSVWLRNPNRVKF